MHLHHLEDILYPILQLSILILDGVDQGPCSIRFQLGIETIPDFFMVVGHEVIYNSGVELLLASDFPFMLGYFEFSLSMGKAYDIDPFWDAASTCAFAMALNAVSFHLCK